ncbi:prenyltransferase/squalene oxidase repeat-containing protein [Nocardioides pacificus]
MLSRPAPVSSSARARRTAGVLAAPVLALTLAVAGCGGESSDPGATKEGASDSGSPSVPAPDSPRADAAADWLLDQREEGVLVGEYGADYGLTIDTALALEPLPAYDESLAEIAETMTKHVASYTTGVAFGSADVYAGAVAKTAVLAQVAGAEATDFGEVDLIDRLEQRVADEAPVAGRLGDEVTDPKGTDYANVIGQAYAARALAAAGSDEAGAATSYLLSQQCEAGFFRLYFTAPDAAEQGCDDGDAEASAPDPDVTALAVLSLAPQQDDPDVEAAVDSAVSWLLGQQLEDGSFGGGTSTEAPNANSTGLVGWALGSQGEEDAASRAADWLAARQITDQACDVPGLAGEAGAVAYDDAALSAAEEGDAKTLDKARVQWRSSTVQALPALRWAGDDETQGWQDC